MIQSTLNNVYVRIKSRYIRNFTKILRMAAIQNNTSIEAADFVNIVGEVVSVPMEISTWKREYRGYSAKDIRVGDTAIFSNLVVYNFVQKDPEAEPIFKNSFWYNGEELWRVDVQNLYAVVRDGEIRMQNGYVMVGEMEKPSPIILSQHTKKKAITAAKAIVTDIEMNPVIKRGDTIYYSPNHIRLHQINEKPFGILRMNQVLGSERRLIKKFLRN